MSERTGTSTPRGEKIVYLNLEAFAYYGGRRGTEEYDPEPWIASLEETFGPGTGEGLLKALMLQSSILMNISRLVGQPWGVYKLWKHHCFFQQAGLRIFSIGDTYCVSKPHWRKNLLSVADAVALARTYQPDPELMRDYAERMGAVDPLQYTQGMVEEAKEALGIAQSLRDRVKPDALEEYMMLVKHMRGTVFFGEHWLNLLTAKVIFEAVDSGYHTYDGKDRGRYARLAIEYFEQALDSLRKLDELVPVRDPSGNSYWHVKEREEELTELKERLKKYVSPAS